MRATSTKPLTTKQKMKAMTMLSYAPAGFFEKHGIPAEFETVGDVVAAVEVFHTYLIDITPAHADKIYASIKRSGEYNEL